MDLSTGCRRFPSKGSLSPDTGERPLGKQSERRFPPGLSGSFDHDSSQMFKFIPCPLWNLGLWNQGTEARECWCLMNCQFIAEGEQSAHSPRSRPQVRHEFPPRDS